MPLANWILEHLAEVLQAWERNAEAILPEALVSKSERRDHAEAMLRRIANEMNQPKTVGEQSQQARGDAPEPQDTTSAQRHGADRMRSGIDAVQMTTEFLALRSSVIQLWTEELDTADRNDLEDLIRFGQAMDRALAESVESFTRERQKKERLFQTMLTASPDANYILDTEGRFLNANRATQALFDTEPDQLIGSTIGDLGLDHQEDFQSQLEIVIQTRAPLRDELTIEHSDGSPRCFEYIYTPVMNSQDQVEAVLGSARDVTERRQTEARIWHHANYDPLTELPNRRLFLDRLEQQTKQSGRSGTPFALFFIDLDRFKEVNDLLGHDGGDLLLKQAAERIRSCVRETDTIARLGGDEFTVILLDTDDLAQIEQLAQEILTLLEKPFRLGDEVARISGSIGITRHPLDAQTPRELLKNADQAMYVAKRKGRNQFFCFAQVLEQAAAERARLVRDLRSAVAMKQFQLLYQPIIDLSDGRTVKAEALLRWAHPIDGLLRPSVFLELAEETGLLGEIENWAFTEVAACSKRWNSLLRSPFQVSLNLSAGYFSHQTPKMPWAEHLEKIGLPGHGVTIEFPEGVLSHAHDGLADRLARVKDAGISLALDDFGTGQSSMAYLKQFNISYLKVDPSFIRGDDQARIIAQAIITMAHSLGLQVIAEGVETQAQRDWLVEAGCDYAQGYYFSKPIPEPNFTALLVGAQ